MKRLIRILMSLFLFLSLTSCNNTTTIDGVTFNIDWNTFYPTQTTYVHYGLDIDSCPDYIHYEVKSFEKEYNTWYTYVWTSNGTMIMSHLDFKGIIITTSSNETIFLKGGTFNFFIGKCPYCIQE